MNLVCRFRSLWGTLRVVGVVFVFGFLTEVLPIASEALGVDDAVQKVGSASQREFVLKSVYTTVDVSTGPLWRHETLRTHCL